MEQIAQDTHVTRYVLGPSELFTLFFVMLGPLKILVPFAQFNKDADTHTLRKNAIQATIIATISVLIGGFLGNVMLGNWHISPEALLLAAGLIFLLVALAGVLSQYNAPPAATPERNIFRFVFPTVVSPYGVAAVIALLALTTEKSRMLLVVGMVLFVMLLNFLAMVFVRPILKAGLAPLQVLGAVLGVLQVALALQIILMSLHRLGIIPSSGLLPG